jgi:PAS domain S-box-containing protein
MLRRLPRVGVHGQVGVLAGVGLAMLWTAIGFAMAAPRQPDPTRWALLGAGGVVTLVLVLLSAILVGVTIRPMRGWQESEALRQAVVQHTRVGVAGLGLDGRFRSANPALCAMLGYSETELRRLTYGDVTGAGDLAARGAAAPTPGAGTDLVAEECCVRKDGSVFWAELRVTAVRDRDGRPRSFVAVIHDMTDRNDKRSRAAQVQSALLPSGSPPLDGYELAARCVPADEVGGDFFDWYVSAPGELTVTIGDVMGKGMSAALLMATVRSALRAAARSDSLTEGLRLASDSIALDFDLADTFVTLLHARLDQRTGRIVYVDAGHGYTFILGPDGGVTHLKGRGLPLAVLPGQTYREAETELEPGATFVAFSDGVSDLHPALAARLEPLAAILAGADSADEVVRRLTHGAAGTRAHDDVTVLALRRSPGSPTSFTIRRARQRPTPSPN